MGLYERNYMNNVPPEGKFYSLRPVWILIAVNVGLHMLDLQADWSLYSDPRLFRFYQLLTAGFVHADIGHLFFNMYGLYLFGSLVADKIRPGRFFALYVSGILTGNLLYLAANAGGGGCLLGASGAVCAVMTGAALLEPDRRFVMIFAPMTPIRTSTLVIGYAALEMLFELFGTGGQIAHLAHLGGFLAGYVYLKAVLRNTLAWDPLRSLKRSGARAARPRPTVSEDGKKPVSPQELDALLDKISRDGINSLTPEEYARLRQAREEMRRG
ncbi:MAG: rhomboid family intramembrane serine protease [Victivallaceae bacterium]|nr:rhomboid family intramembrane serine protease [Victivallaceae bacterium]